MYRGTTAAVPGLVSAGIDIWKTVKLFTRQNVLTEVLFRLTDAPDGDLIIELNDQIDGSGESQQVTFASGETYAEETSLTKSMGSLYQNVVSEAGSQIAMNLTGEYTLNTVVGVEDYFTTLERVQLDADISGTDDDRDTVLNTIIAGVTREMQDWMGRQIVQGTATAEKIDGWYSEEIRTRHYPIIEIASLSERGTALVEGTAFESLEDDKAEGRIVRISGDIPIFWGAGRRKVSVTYDHGYIAVPESLAQAATAMSVVRYKETVQSGKGWRGLASKGVEPSASTTLDKEIWAREVIPAMRPFRRLVA